MLMRTDPFRDLDRLAETFFGTPGRPAVMHVDAEREGDWFYVHFDLPGVDPDSIDLTVERNVLTVKAERRWQPEEDLQFLLRERPQGSFTRQIVLSDAVDADKIEARYENGVLLVTAPVAEAAKPHKIEIKAGNGHGKAITSGTSKTKTDAA